MELNVLNYIDAYKLDHRRQYPVGTEVVYSNWTPRGSRLEGVDHVTFFGLQYFLDEYLTRQWGKFFEGNIDDIAAKYEARTTGILGPNEVGTQHIRDLHALGYLPLIFKAVPEGTSVPLRVPMLTVENTDKRFAWLVNYMETIMSNVLWMPCTSATIAKRMRSLLVAQAERSGGPVEFVDWQGHDFSFRGMSGLEAAVTSGAGHLCSFTGTDTIPAIDFIEQYYPTDSFIGGSVAATEHSVMCAGGEDGELETFERLLKLYPSGILSVVSDTWSIWDVLTKTVPTLATRIMARNGKLVIRPDSGDPADIVCGDPLAVQGTPEALGVVQLLWDTFGGTVNSKGFKELDSHIGVIYGDSINFERAKDITDRLIANGYASTNIVFGCGSYGYQFNTRDTFGFAMKASWVKINGEDKNIFKKPVTGNGEKNSAIGRLAVIENNYGQLILVEKATPEQEAKSILQTVWENGKFIRHFSFDEVRSNIKI